MTCAMLSFITSLRTSEGIMQTMSALAQANFPCQFVRGSEHDLIINAEPLALAITGLRNRKPEDVIDRPERAWSGLTAH
jgi:hypothetical protein